MQYKITIQKMDIGPYAYNVTQHFGNYSCASLVCRDLATALRVVEEWANEHEDSLKENENYEH